MALSTPSLLSCRSVCLVNPIRFAPSTRRFRARPFRWNPCRPNRKFFSGMWFTTSAWWQFIPFLEVFPLSVDVKIC
ncbi:hypothetical protein BHM03_00003989 [Ensete ventricosum]|nr:hypothetical protein BHM03_00003989 [Ensete ventricosum]